MPFQVAFFHRYQDADSSRRLLEEMEKADECGIADSGKDIGYSFTDVLSPLHQYMGKARAEIFFDTGDGFCEESKTVVEYKASDGEQPVAFVLDIPDSCSLLRRG